MTVDLKIEFGESVARLTIDRPGKRNALTCAMYGGLAEAILRAENDPAIRTILITGGASCFTAGNDVADFLGQEEWTSDSPVIAFIRAISGAKKPIVAAVNGAAVGVGVTMLLHCDLVYAGESAVFRTPFVALGLVPEAGSSYLLPRIMGHQRAAELLLLGKPLDARTAHALGLVTAVTKDEDTLKTALEAVATLNASSAEAVLLTKSLMKRDTRAVREAMEAEEALFFERLKSPDVVAAARKFLGR